MKKVVPIAAALIFISAFSLNAFGQKATRIKFARGATRASVSGTLNGYKSEKLFVIRVKAGQTLRTQQVGNSHDITIVIENPEGEDVSDSDASCNNRREVSPTEAGNYHIRVVECQKADRWRGRFRFRVSVSDGFHVE